MGNIFRRMLESLGFFFSAFFNIRLKLKYVLLFCILLGGGIYAWTYTTMLNNVGGKEDYAEAMRYIQIKDIVDEEFIAPVDRVAMGNAAAAAMVSSLGDSWSKFMSAEEYKTFQLSASNEYSDIGMSLMKNEEGKGFQVISVNPDSPAARAALARG